MFRQLLYSQFKRKVKIVKIVLNIYFVLYWCSLIVRYIIVKFVVSHKRKMNTMNTYLKKMIKNIHVKTVFNCYYIKRTPYKIKEKRFDICQLLV